MYTHIPKSIHINLLSLISYKALPYNFSVADVSLHTVFNFAEQNSVHATCADLAKYYSSCKCCIWGDITIYKSKAQRKQWDGNCLQAKM